MPSLRCMQSRQTLTEGLEARRRIHAKLAARAARDSKGAAAAHFASLAASPAAGGVAASKAGGAWHAADAHGDDSDGALRAISHDLAISEHDLAWALSQPMAHLEQHARAWRLLPAGAGVACTDAGRPRSPTPDSAGSTGVGCEAQHQHDSPHLASDANGPLSFRI
jgi:hypothetical protein